MKIDLTTGTVSTGLHASQRIRIFVTTLVEDTALPTALRILCETVILRCHIQNPRILLSWRTTRTTLDHIVLAMTRGKAR